MYSGRNAALAAKVQVNTVDVEVFLTQAVASHGSHRSLTRATTGRVWAIYRDKLNAYVYAAFSDDGGATWTEERVSAAASQGSGAQIIMVDSSDVAHAIWLNRQGSPDTILYASRSTGSWVVETAYTSGGIVNNMAACIDSANSFHFAWEEDTAGDDIHYITGTAGAWGARETVSTTGNSPLDITVDGSDVPIIIYELFTGGSGSKLQYRDRNGGSWNAAEVASTNFDGSGNEPLSIAIDSSDDLHVAWAGESVPGGSGNKDTRYRKRQGGVWQTEIVVKVPDGNDDMLGPAIILDTAGDAYIIYQSDGSDEGVFYKKITSGSIGSESVLDSGIIRPGNLSSVYAGMWQRYPASSILVADQLPISLINDEVDSTTAKLMFWTISDAGIPKTIFYVEVDWNKDGDFDDLEEDITVDVEQVREVNGREAELETTPAGTMELTVDDPDGDYSPTNSSTRFGNGNVTVGRPIRLRVAHLGTFYNLWRGTIERIRVDPRPDIKKAYLFCVDGRDQLDRVTINAPSTGPLSNVYIGATGGPLEEILDAAGWPAADRVADSGADLLSEWWAHRKTAGAALDELETGEKSFMYIAGDGKHTYEDRHHRLKDGQGGAADHRTSQGTFTETMTALPQDFSARTVRNIALVTGHKRVVKASAYVFGMLDTPTIDNGSSETFWVDLPNPASAITETEANVDWKANRQADGSGTDETSNVSIVTTFFGQSVRMVVTNSAGVRIYLIPGTSDPNETLRIRATEYDDTELVAESSDSTSKTKHGDRSIEVETLYVGNVNTLKAYADWLKDRFKDPHQDNLVMELLGSTDALITQILARELSDRVTLTSAHLGISSVDFFIEKKEIEVSQGGKVIKGRFTLAEDLEPANPWLLGDAGFSELGDTTFLGF